MPPRRRSKKTADADADSARSTPPPVGSFTIGPLLQDVNLDALANFFPGAPLETPSAVLVVQCYKLILNQAQQLDEKERTIETLEADAERKEIELDQALQDKENLLAELDTNVKDVQDELAKVKEEKEEIATSRASLQAELEKISTSQSSSSSEATTLKKKIEEVEREKRDLLGVVSRLQEDVAERDEEITTLRENLKIARKEAQELESNLRDIRASERSTTFKVETLTHQLQLAKDENERTNAELTKKSEEYSNYRRDKHTELVQLQSELDQVKQTHNQTVTTLRTLQASHNSQSQQLSQALQKVHDLTNQLADQEAKYSSETANLKRLVQMMEERENQAKEIVAGIERDWEGLGEKAAENERKLRDELEAEQRRSKEFEEEVEELRGVIDRINSGELPVPSAPGAHASPNVSSDSLHSFSPNISLISSMQKSGKSFTQVYAEYMKMQNEIVARTREKEHLERTLTQVLADLEEATPAIERQKKEIERVRQEADELASQLSQALSDREAALIQVENSNKTVRNTQRENILLNKQLDDLGRQLKALLKELGRLHDATLPSDEDMQDIQPVINVEEVITNNLVLYRSIPELQEQNMRLLKCVRELGSRMELEEREYRQHLENEQNEAIREAHEAIQALQAQLESTQSSHHATIEAYKKERDTLKTMLARYERGGASPAATAGSSATDTQADSTAPHVNGVMREPTELEKELEEERAKFAAYREEMGVDSVKLREEVIQYQRQTSQLSAALAKANAKIEFLNERHRMAQEQYVMREREAQNLQKRNQQLHDQYTRLDIACNHAAEELSSANAQIERLRNECSNLRAEKKIWENVQTRLLDENKILSLERSRMADLIGNVQKMHNDIDRANESDRRRFESQIHTLEAQTQDLRTQLSHERDAVRQVSLQKDIETQELRTKIDRSVENLSKAREALVEAETSRKHLQGRVDELVKQVQMNEEKLAVYERRTTSVAVTSGSVPSRSNGEDAGSEEELRTEIAELRAALKAAEVDLASVQGHVQQYQEISQASEAALQSLSATHDEYKASTESQIAKFESDQKALEDKVSSLQDELSRLNAKNAELQQTLEKERAAFAQDKKMLEGTIVDITNAEMNSRNDQASRESEVREQMERVKAAEDKYSREIIAHAESLKLVDSLKKELDETRTTLREKTMQTETAQANIAASENSWNQQREALNKEIADLTARAKDLASQNALLHQHLESVSSQASRIRQAADSDVNVPDASEGDDADGRIAELRSVIAYLRKEKDIVDLQLELAKQENARQKAQIDHLSQALQETRATLSNEREQAAKAIGNSADHAELLERINQLNILRESNATLRAESDAHARKVRQLETSLNQLQSELGPVKEEAKALRAEVEAKDAQILKLEEENRQWKERNTQLLTKYDRIDPNDVQALKDEIEDLQIDLRKAEEEKTGYTAEKEAQAKLLEDTQNTLTEFRSKYTALVQESRNRLGHLNQQMAKSNETIADLRKQVKELTAEKDRLASQVATAPSAAPADVTAELESLKAQLASAVQEKETSAKLLADEMNKAAKAAADHEAALSTIREERDRLLAEKASSQVTGAQPVSGDAVEKVQKLEAERAELTKARDEALARAKSAEENAVKALNEARNFRLQNEKFQARIAENEKRRIADSEKLAALTERHKQEQEEAVTAATEKLRAELQSNPAIDTSEITARHAQELRALEARLVAKNEAELKTAVEKAREEATKAGASAAHPGPHIISKEEHEQALKAATERGRMESTTKLKLKDGMLQKAQANVKHLEAQIKAWREAGIIPANAPTIPPGSVSTPVKAATASIPAKPTVSASPSTGGTAGKVHAPAHPTGPSSAATATPAVLPKKPTLSAATTTAHAGATSTDTSARGARGGAVRGVRGARGVARGGARGGAPAAVAQAAQAAAATASSTDGSVSIMGAAAKRAREDTTENAVESLAKRIKPAEGAGAKPIALRRDRIATTPNPTAPS